MKAKKVQAFQLKGERNISARMPLLMDDKLLLPFVFDLKGRVASRLLCLDKSTFEVLWTFDHPFVINNLLRSPLGTLLVCYMDGKLKELDTANGALLHSHELGLERCGHSSAIEADKILVGGVQGSTSTVCFDLNSATIRWSFDTGGHSYTPLISGNKVYQCTERMIRCLDLDTGSLIWEAREDSTYIFNPIAIQDCIAVGGHGLVNIYDGLSGQLLHQIDTGVREAIRSLVYDQDCLFFGDGSGVFYAYRFEQGKNAPERLWTFASSGEIESRPAIKGENILFINDDNKLIALRRSDGELQYTFNTKGKGGISGVLMEGADIFTAVGKGHAYRLEEV